MLSEIRKKIDKIDNSLVELLVERMKTSGEVAAFKKANGMQVLDRAREQAILEKREAEAGEEFGAYIREIYEKIFEQSRNYQEELLK